MNANPTELTKSYSDVQCQLLFDMFNAAVSSALPAKCIPPNLPARPKGRTVVIGAGKAAASMSRAVEDNWDGPLKGVVVTRYGHAVACRRINVLEAAHPIPDEAGVDAASAVLRAVSDLTRDDLVLCLLSGGGSALLPALPPGVSLADEQDLTRRLLRSGASIGEINCVRSQVSRIRGGRLAAAAYPAKVVSLIISDVPGDIPSLIASGPTTPSISTSREAMAILERYNLDVPDAIQTWLQSEESLPPAAGELAHASHVIIASAKTALETASHVAQEAGYRCVILGDAIEGEARNVGRDQARIAYDVLSGNQPVEPPCILLSGGETSVTVRTEGPGGRNAEFLLGFMAGSEPRSEIYALAADTDGIDGTEENAGVIMDPSSWSRAAEQHLDPMQYLDQNNAYSFFKALGDLVVTGPTRTNVNDFRAILIDPSTPS